MTPRVMHTRPLSSASSQAVPCTDPSTVLVRTNYKSFRIRSWEISTPKPPTARTQIPTNVDQKALKRGNYVGGRTKLPRSVASSLPLSWAAPTRRGGPGVPALHILRSPSRDRREGIEWNPKDLKYPNGCFCKLLVLLAGGLIVEGPTIWARYQGP